MKASRTIGEGIDAVTFAVEYFVTDGDRTRWRYTITAADRTALGSGTDLAGPDHDTAENALRTLIVFAHNALEEERRGNVDHGFDAGAVDAFEAIESHLELTMVAFDEEDEFLAPMSARA